MHDVVSANQVAAAFHGRKMKNKAQGDKTN